LPDSLYLSALRTQSLPFRIQEFIEYSVVDIAKKTLTKAIHDEAVLKKMPQRYTNNIHTEFVGGELWIWVDFRGKKGEKLDLFFEEGTVDHKIEPRIKKALAFIKKGAIGVFSSFMVFSQGHWVTGIRARHVFAEGTKKGYPEFKKVLKEEVEEYIEETRLFG